MHNYIFARLRKKKQEKVPVVRPRAPAVTYFVKFIKYISWNFK